MTPPAVSPRTRRLRKELEAMTRLRQNSSLIDFTSEGTEPTRYDVVLSCRGLLRQLDTLLPVERHGFEIVLERDFPLVAPAIVWKTPIFHPNFKPPSVCLGDHWYPGWSVAEMCVAICEMVQYKSYNVYDPLDRDAALWLQEHLEQSPEEFPLDRRPVRDLEFEISRVQHPTDN